MGFASRAGFWICTALLSCPPLLGRPFDAEAGIPFLASWDYKDYLAHSQNWAVVQHPNGVLYFGNGDGVLEHDGVSWRLIRVANQSIVRSLAVDDTGTVYVGAVSELGYLRPDETGSLSYVSLLTELDAEERDLGDAWRTFATDRGIFFWTFRKLLLWHGDRFRSWDLNSKRVAGLVRGELLNNDPERGLSVFRGDSFQALAGGERLADFTIMAMLPFGDDEILIASRAGDLFAASFPPAANAGHEV